MICTNCGKEIQEGSTFCPECGYSNPTNKPRVQKAHYNTMCIIGFAVSCISLLLNFWGLVGIAGTITSLVGLSICNQKNESGKALAIIGIVIGVFSILWGVIAIIAASKQ